VDEIEGLEIGKSDHAVADAIAAKFGIAPPPYWLRNRYNKENCAAPDHLDRCTYILLMNNSPVELLLQKHQSMPRLGIPEWWGNARPCLDLNQHKRAYQTPIQSGAMR
jgi:hypothetical protein